MEAEVLASRPAPPPPPDDDDDEPFSTAVAPLRWAGPYPRRAAVPEATAAQKERGERGVTLDFVVDTAASVNTIRRPSRASSRLRRVGAAPDGVGAAARSPAAISSRSASASSATSPRPSGSRS